MGYYKRQLYPGPYQPQKRKNPITFYVFCTVIAGLIIFIIRASLTLPYFYIKTIQVEGTERLSEAEVLQQINLSPNTSIFNLNIQHLCEKIQSQPLIKKVILRKKLPSTLVVRVMERVPYALVGIGKEFWEVDEEGVVLGSGKDQEELPLIKGIDPSQDKEILTEALRALEISRQLGLAVQKIEVEKKEEKIVIYLKDKIELILGIAPNYNYLFYVPDILQDARARGEKFLYLDLRFENQIVASRK